MVKTTLTLAIYNLPLRGHDENLCSENQRMFLLLFSSLGAITERIVGFPLFCCIHNSSGTKAVSYPVDNRGPGIVDPEEIAVAKEWLVKNVSLAINTHAAIEGLFDTMFSVQSVLYILVSVQ
jgi:hypothetical protein